MERTVRRSMRLATKKDRRKRRNRAAATRLRSPITRNRDRMSVGEVMGLSPAASSAVNLSEARAMDSARAAAVNAGAGRSRRRRARSKSAKGRAKTPHQGNLSECLNLLVQFPKRKCRCSLGGQLFM